MSNVSFDEFIAHLPIERQQPMRQVWEVVRTAVPVGYTEQIGPKYLEFRAGTEMCLALASQKSHMSLHLIPIYLMPALRDQLHAAAPRLKLGKGCLNFKKVEELPLQAVAEVIAATPMAEFLATMQSVRSASREKG